MRGLFFVLLVMLSGCATIGNSVTIQRLGVAVAVGKIIENADNPGAKAARVIDVANKAKLLLEGDEELFVSDIRLRVENYIDYASMAPRDQMLTHVLISEVQRSIEVRIATHRLNPDSKVKITQILDAVIQAARYYRVSVVS